MPRVHLPDVLLIWAVTAGDVKHGMAWIAVGGAFHVRVPGEMHIRRWNTGSQSAFRIRM